MPVAGIRQVNAGMQASPDRADSPWQPFSIPLRTAFRGQMQRRGAVIKGPCGWGEYSPFPGYHSVSGLQSCRRAALSAALQPWPAPVRRWIPVHVTVPAVGPEAAAAMVQESGCRAAKVKVAEGDDDARLEAVRDALGPDGRLVVDANGAWQVDEAVRRITQMVRYGVNLVEQPVAGLEDLAQVRRRSPVPVAADELVVSREAVRRLVQAEAADVLILKVQSLGGVAAALEAAEESGLPVVVSSLLETSVGVAAGLALAGALPELAYPCGLGTVPLLDGDLVSDSLVPVRGQIQVRRPEVDPALLERYAASGDVGEGSR